MKVPGYPFAVQKDWVRDCMHKGLGLSTMGLEPHKLRCRCRFGRLKASACSIGCPMWSDTNLESNSFSYCSEFSLSKVSQKHHREQGCVSMSLVINRYTAHTFTFLIKRIHGVGTGLQSRHSDKKKKEDLRERNLTYFHSSAHQAIVCMKRG